MVSWDYLVGFEKEPVGLDDFLARKGYTQTTAEGNSHRSYESRTHPVDIFYFPTIEPEEDENPWKESRRNIACELMVSTKELESLDEAQRITRETLREYDSVLYDPNDPDAKEI